ncbi:MAG: XRE family transcriptional regulator [Gammaproteobacteria bacterium]|nr:XRE family transcriptional regulator [Gammaproteobacteria bacterium]MCW8839854.1 XRE family transcriptional regulator [Gammaproteobacteria bacterium]MCW8992575.1 XRE family transcriptional regulator [Gammaproteobacteria bacterium]
MEARKARGLTQAALAELLGRASSTISRWEAGTQYPEPEAMDKLAAQLNVPYDYFLKPQPSTGGAPKFFRSMSTATKRARERLEQKLAWLQDISFDVQKWLEFPEVDLPEIDLGHFSTIRDEDIEDAAIKCREHWRLGSGPIPDVLLTLENAGVVVAYAEFDTNAIDGVSTWSEIDSRPYVLLAKDKQTAVRSRFDAAHELGHIVLHRGVDQKKLTNPAEFKEIERQAHRFASAFLLPAESFTSELWKPTLDAFVSLKPRWKVSVGAMIHRSAELLELSEIYTTKLWKSRSARRWTRQEPFDDKLKPEEPRLLKRSIELLLTDGGVAVDTLLSDIRLNSSDIEKLCGLNEGYLSQQPAQIHEIPMPRVRENKRKSSETGKVVPFPSGRGN